MHGAETQLKIIAGGQSLQVLLHSLTLTQLFVCNRVALFGIHTIASCPYHTTSH